MVVGVAKVNREVICLGLSETCIKKHPSKFRKLISRGLFKVVE